MLFPGGEEKQGRANLSQKISKSTLKSSVSPPSFIPSFCPSALPGSLLQFSFISFHHPAVSFCPSRIIYLSSLANHLFFIYISIMYLPSCGFVYLFFLSSSLPLVQLCVGFWCNGASIPFTYSKYT